MSFMQAQEPHLRWLDVMKEHNPTYLEINQCRGDELDRVMNKTDVTGLCSHLKQCSFHLITSIIIENP